MNPDDPKTGKPAVNLPGEAKKIDRREFLTAAGKMVVPTLGILGLSLFGTAGRARAYDCGSTCSGSCSPTCIADCASGCSTSCSGHCFGGCAQGCTGNCGNTCWGNT